MKRSLLVSALLSFSLIAAGARADAPENGVVGGVVTDAGGTPLPGVSVTLSGERGEKAAITSEDGRYQFVLLQPGAYRVRAELEGIGVADGEATVSAGGRETVDLKLRLETAEEITVTSEAPMVDKFNVTAGTTVQAEVGTQTAGTTRSFYGLVSALPGVASDAENADIQGTRPSVNGSHFADQYVFVDGVDATWGKYGGSRLFIPTTSVTEVSMEGGGSSAEYGRSIGSTTNVIVKSGTNNFHGAALVQRQEVDWGSDYKDQPILEERQFVPFPRDWLKLDELEEDAESTGYETSFGGPFKRDKAWFFLAWSDFDDNATEKLLGGDPQDASFQMESKVVKLNFQPSAAHTVTASYMDTPSKRVYSHPPSFDYWTPTPHDISSDLASLTWNWSISSNVFLEAKLAAQESTEHKLLNCGSIDVATCLQAKQQDRGPDGEGDLRFPANPAAGPHWPGNNYGVYLDQGFVGAWHNGWILDDGFGNNVFPRDQVNASATQFVGEKHEIKYGLDYQDTKWEGEQHRTSLYSGYDFDALNPYGYRNAGIAATKCSFALPNNACLFRDYNAEFLTSDRGSGDSEVENLAFYARDRFTLGERWTFNVGFRAETQEGLNDVRRTVFEDDYISPRASVSYDVKADGEMLLSLNVGRYHALLNQAWIYQRLDDKWQGTRGFRDYLFCSPFDVGLGNTANFFNHPLFSQCREKGVGYNAIFRDFADVTIWDLVDQGYFDSDIKPYYKDELILGFEWQFAGNWALDAKAIYWELGDMIGSTVQLGPRGEQFELAANYKDYPSIIRQLEAARRANGLPQQVSEETLQNFEEGMKEYQALQVQVNRRFHSGWALYNNLTWSETETTGSGAWWNNTNSEYGEELHVVLTPTMIDQCQAAQAARSHPENCVALLTPHLGEPVSTLNRRGPDNNTDRPIIFNSFGFKRFDVGNHDVTVGGHLQFQTGLPWVREESVATSFLTGGNAASDSVLLMLFPFGTGGRRTPDTYTLNLSAAWGFPLGWKALRGELRVESINVTNEQELTLLEFGRLSGRPGEAGLGDAYPTRRAFQRPRQVRANLTVRF